MAGIEMGGRSGIELGLTQGRKPLGELQHRQEHFATSNDAALAVYTSRIMAMNGLGIVALANSSESGTVTDKQQLLPLNDYDKIGEGDYELVFGSSAIPERDLRGNVYAYRYDDGSRTQTVYNYLQSVAKDATEQAQTMVAAYSAINAAVERYSLLTTANKLMTADHETRALHIGVFVRLEELGVNVKNLDDALEADPIYQIMEGVEAASDERGDRRLIA